MERISLTDNRLFLAWGIVVIVMGIKVALIDVDVDEIWEDIAITALRDFSSLFIVWLGLTIATEKE